MPTEPVRGDISLYTAARDTKTDPISPTLWCAEDLIGGTNEDGRQMLNEEQSAVIAKYEIHSVSVQADNRAVHCTVACLQSSPHCSRHGPADQRGVSQGDDQ